MNSAADVADFSFFTHFSSLLLGGRVLFRTQSPIQGIADVS
jgi:hypothetical protein